jgi:hypothetical protein
LDHSPFPCDKPIDQRLKLNPSRVFRKTAVDFNDFKWLFGHSGPLFSRNLPGASSGNPTFSNEIRTGLYQKIKDRTK